MWKSLRSPLIHKVLLYQLISFNGHERAYLALTNICQECSNKEGDESWCKGGKCHQCTLTRLVSLAVYPLHRYKRGDNTVVSVRVTAHTVRTRLLLCVCACASVGVCVPSMETPAIVVLPWDRKRHWMGERERLEYRNKKREMEIDKRHRQQKKRHRETDME